MGRGARPTNPLQLRPRPRRSMSLVRHSRNIRSPGFARFGPEAGAKNWAKLKRVDLSDHALRATAVEYTISKVTSRCSRRIEIDANDCVVC